MGGCGMVFALLGQQGQCFPALGAQCGLLQALQRLAQKVAGKVTRYRRNITLEPMNAYERHVIHAALQDHPDVTTFSTGTEPNRRIVVAYSRYKSAEAAVKKDFPETEEE